MSSIEDAITYPMESDDWIPTVIVGGVLTLLGVLVIPMFLVYGYLVRALRANLEGNPEPPTFGDWGELLVDGVKAAIVLLVYMIVPLIVMAVTVGSAMVALLTGGEPGAVVGFGGLMVGMVVSFVLLLVFGYLSVIGLVNFAREERLGAAFDVSVVREVGSNSEFAVPWLLSVGVFIAASVVNVVPFVGAVIAVFTNFYALMVASRLWTDGFTRAADAGGSTGRTDVDETAG